MILLRKLKYPLPITNLLFHSIATTTVNNISNPLSQIPLQKVLQMCANKKCNRPQDAMFCILLFENLCRINKINEKLQTNTNAQASRLIQNSLGYMHQLPLKETLLLANYSIEAWYTKKINVNYDTIFSFMEKVNQNIIKASSKDKQGIYVGEIVKYIKKIVMMKNSGNLLKQIISYLVSQAKRQQQKNQVLHLFYQLKYKNTLVIQNQLKSFLQQHIASKVDTLELKSLLIDEIVLKIFYQFKFHIKKPYNCVPNWFFKYLQKLKLKYNNQQYLVPLSKKISFLKYYCRLMTETLFISQVASISQKGLQFTTGYFQYIKQQLFSSDYQNTYDKLFDFLHLMKTYKKFIQKNPYCQVLQHSQVFNQIFQRIFDTFLSNLNYLNISVKQQQRLCSTFVQYSNLYCINIRDQKKGAFNKNLAIKIFDKNLQMYINLLRKNEMNFQRYQYIFPLLNSLGLLFENLKQNYSLNMLTNARINHNLKNIIQYTSKLIQKIGIQSLLQIYGRNNNNNSNSNLHNRNKLNIDFVGTFYLFLKYIDANIPQNISKIYEIMKQTNFTAIIETVSNSPYLQKQLIQQQLLKLSQQLIQRTKKHIEQSKIKEQNRNNKKINSNVNLQTTFSGYLFKSIQDQYASNTIATFKNGSTEKVQLISKLYQFWFIKNQQFIKLLWYPHYSFMTQIAWFCLTLNMRYIHASNNKCGVDLMAEIYRICWKECLKGESKNNFNYNKKNFHLFQQRFNLLLSQRMVQNIIYKKFDIFAEYKFMLFITSLVNYNTSLIRKQHKQQLTTQHVTNNNNNESKNFKKTYKKHKHDETQQNLSLFKLIQLLHFSVLDFKKPLQMGTFHSRYICKIMNNNIRKIINFIELNKIKQQDETKTQRGKQLLLGNSPIQQLIYFIIQQNCVIDNQNWFKDISVANMFHSISGKYDKLTQYNLLLAFDLKDINNKKFHDIFLSERLQQLDQNSRKLIQNNQISDIQTQQNIFKYYFYFLAPTKTQQTLQKHIQIIKQKQRLTQQQVLRYWLNKNIVLRTVNEKLISAMLVRFIQIKLQLSYMQFATALNTIITLFNKGQLQDFHKLDENKKNSLIKWVYKYLQIFAAQNSSTYLLDYFTLRKYFGQNKFMENKLDQMISKLLCANQIDILEHLFQSKYKLNENSIKQLKIMLKKLKQRCLTQDYYSIQQSCQFRVQLLLQKTFGLILFQQNLQLLQWFCQQFMASIDVSNLQLYLLKEENKNILVNLLIRHSIVQNKLQSKYAQSDVKNLFNKLLPKYTHEIHTKISVQQKTRSQLLKQEQYLFTKLGQTQILLIQKPQINNPSKNQYIYLLSTPLIKIKAQQALEILYLQCLNKNVKIQIKTVG